MEKQGILLISHGQFENDFLERIAHDVQIEFDLPVKIVSSYIDLAKFFDPARRQYDGNKLLKFIDSSTKEETVKILGLFQVDLFIPILTFMPSGTAACHSGFFIMQNKIPYDIKFPAI